MPYTATTWTDGSTALNQSHLNNIETQYSESTNSFEQDLFSAFVYSGMVATKDGSINNQLDVTAGIAFLKQTDNTLRRRAPTSSTQTTATPSTTYYLFLNTDGTWTWGTTSTGPTNSLAICQVTTDGSGNISTVTDKRTLGTTLLGSLTGTLTLSSPVTMTAGTLTLGASGVNALISSAQTGALNGIIFRVWSGSAAATPFAIGGGLGGAAANVDEFGDFTGAAFIGNFGTLMLSSQQSGAANGVYLKSWTGSAAVTPFSIGGQYNSALTWVDNSGNFNGPAGGGLPVTRNNTAGSTPIYTGTTSPSSPPTGSIWVKA